MKDRNMNHDRSSVYFIFLSFIFLYSVGSSGPLLVFEASDKLG